MGLYKKQIFNTSLRKVLLSDGDVGDGGDEDDDGDEDGGDGDGDDGGGGGEDDDGDDNDDGSVKVWMFVSPLEFIKKGGQYRPEAGNAFLCKGCLKILMFYTT